ncbi:MAG: uroporphyrinogen-III C-methyltransferase [Limimaricola sp.]|uniref:siroheme synthase CysG n=1 Tax=Limimaricola sp. TaxID=2211665 RepID=UPI001D226E20|nr:siroheme synthase CysG [Limimaricola sp.]MBI1418438.1 uroporphyrinogen-III C-methyltransferase [Limimaricola sp.]
MRHFPIFLAVAGRRVVVAGGGETALAKLRLLLKTEAQLTVFARDASPDIHRLAKEGRLRLVARAFGPGDALCAVLAYAATEDPAEDARVASLARVDGALVNIVDNLQDSAFITPAIVDRDPVVVAIGTEGAAPVLARQIKADLEERLPASLGALARIGRGLRAAAATLAPGGARRAFWADFYLRTGPRTIAENGLAAVPQAAAALLEAHRTATPAPASVTFVGAGPGDPDLLTLKARKALDTADVVLHDRLVPPAILELARREAVLIDVGKQGFGTSTAQDDINALLLAEARPGRAVVRLKAGDPSVFARLDEETEALAAAGIAWQVMPGVTAASAAAAQIGQSLTRRGRNSGLRLLTAHDAAGFAEQDWRALARPGEVAGIYMGKRAARFLQGRLMMHGADPATPVTVVENASLPEARTIATTLGALATALADAAPAGPALILYGLAPHAAQAALSPPLLETMP